MANENTQDLAVLGFRIETHNAETALGKIEAKIRGLDSAINITDKLLAEKVQKALTPFNDVRDTIAEIVTSESKLSKAVGSIKDLAETVQGMNNLGEVAKNMKAAFTELDTKYVTKLTQKFINMSKAFNGTAMTLDVAVKVTNPEELDALSKKLLIGIDSTAETQINALNSTLTSIKNGLSVNIKIPDKSELETWAANVDKVVQPEIKFDQKANTIVQNLYTTIRGKIAERGSILVPLQFTFGKPKLDMPDTQITDAVKRGRDALRDTLMENVKDFGGNAQFEKLWEKAILGGPKSIEKIRKVLETRTSWLEEGIEESMKAAALSPSKYGELLEQGMGSIPVEVANAMDKITSQAQHLLEPLQNKLIVRPEVGVAKQSDTEIQKIFNDFSAHVGELASKSLKKVIATAEKVVIQPKSAVVDTAYLQAAVGIVTATKTVTASADVILDPFSIKVKTDNLGPESIKLTRKGLKVDTITFEPDKINFRGLDKIANVLANPVGVNADLKIKPNTVSIDEEAMNKLLPLKYAVKPIDVKSKIKIAPTAATVDSEAAKQIVGTSKTAIKVQSKISLDPLPSDEIEKMGLLVTQINNVDTAYGMLLRTVTALRDTVRETEGSMSKELRGLIKGEQHKAEAKIKDPEKAAAADAEKIKKQAEAEQAALDALAKAQAELQELHKRYQFNPEQNSMDRRKEAKENLDLSKKLEREAGNVANNINEQLDSNTKVQVAFNDKLQQTDKTVQELTSNLKAEAKAMRDKAKVDAAAILNTAKAEAAMRGFSTSVTTAGIEIVKLGRIIPTNLTDPFKTMKAELGETGSRLADFGRMFGLYFSGRTVINYFRQAAESANAFGMEIRRIQSLATDFDFTNLRNELMDIDARFGNVIHNANALYWAYSSGVRGTEKELANFVEIMSKTSTTIKSDIMPTVDAATSIMNAWNLSAGSAAEIGDLLFSIIKYGKSNAQQLTTSLGHVVAPAAALNVNLDELGATIATLTKTMKTNRALTYLSNILGKMASPTKQVQEAAAEMGIELSATAIKARGFAQTLADIRRVTGGDIGKIAKLFPDLRGQRAAITLLSTQYKDFEQQLENMRGKAGAMEEALGKITDTPEAQLKAIRNTISMISIGAGDAVNTTITLGGLLGPILEKINKMEHGGRELLGHLTASVGATVGLAVASRALAAAQFGAAQAAYQMAAAANETHKVELSNALLAEKRRIDENGLTVAALKREVAEKHNNDELLRSLREQAISMKEASQAARQRLADAKQTLNVEDQMLKRRMEDRAVAVGTSRTRLASLGEWLNDLQTGDAQKKLLADINLVKRLQADISISQATLSDEEAQLVGKYRNIIQPLVEQETEARKRMMEAMESGDVESFENQKSFLNYILQQIKTNTGISGQMAQYDTQGRLLEQETRRVMLAEMQKGLVAGQNYEHSLLIQFVEDEIKTEKTKLATLQSDLDVLKQNHATNDEIRTQLDAITKQTAVVNELDAKRLEIQTQIEQRERSLTGGFREQIQILDTIQKEAQQKLQHDMEDVEQLQKNLDLELRRASVIGGATLDATKASTAAYMQMHNVVLQLNTLDRERETLIDKEGNLINESAEAAERVAAIDKERVELQSRLVKLQQQYVDLGVKAGDENARNMRIAGWDKNRGLDALVENIARDKGVVKEAVKAMSAEVGKGIFGGRLGGRGMQGLAIASTMIPGLGRYGMMASMLASFDVFNKSASGMSRLTASLLNMTGATEKLQKKGVLQLNKGVEDLTKSILKSRVTLKGFKLTMDSLRGLGNAGNLRDLASFGSSAAMATAGIAAVLGSAVFVGLYQYFKNNKGPLDDMFEHVFEVEKLKRINNAMDTRLQTYQDNIKTNDEMILSMQRINASLPAGNGNIEQLKAQLSTIHESINDQVLDGNKALLDAQRSYVNSLFASLEKTKYDIGWLKLKQKQLKDNIDSAYSQIGIYQTNLNKERNNALYTIYYSAIEYGMRNPEAFFKFGFDEKLWNKALKNATFDPKVLFATPASSFSKHQQKGFATILSDHDKWFDFIPLMSQPYKLFATYEEELSKNKAQIEQLQETSRGLQNLVQVASLSTLMDNSDKTYIDAEENIIPILNDMEKNIQSQIEFDISISQYQQKEMQRIKEALDKLNAYGNIQNHRLLINQFEDKIKDIEKEREEFLAVAAMSDAQLLEQSESTKKALQDFDNRINDLRRTIEYWENRDNSGSYDQWLEGVAEARYQNLREVLEADRDAAFAPLQDSGRKLELAKKMTNMAFNRLSYVLGNGKELADLTSKTGEDIQEMVRSVVADLSTPMQKIKDEYDLYNEGLQNLKEGTEAYNEQKAKVDELKTKLDAAQKEYQEKTEAIRAASQDFYSREVNEVSAYVQDTMEQIKHRTSKAKYFSMFQKGFGNLKVQEENISQLLKVSETLDKEYTSKTGMFARLSRLNPKKAKETYESEKRQVDDAVMQYRQSYLEMLKGVGESTASLMENIASDLQTSQKSFFEFQLNDPRNAGIQGKLINQQYGLIGSLLYGKNGVIAMRNKALEDAKAFIGAGDEQEALKALGEAQKYQQKQVGYEQQRLGLVKLKADKEKEINQSLFSLASTLQGKFESTSQTAVDAYSEEAIRLQMRRIGENIAPPVQTSAQELERQMMQNFYQENAKSYTMLMQVAEKLQNQIATRSQNADVLGGAASTMERASDTAKVAAETFKRTVESNRTTFRVKRI